MLGDILENQKHLTERIIKMAKSQADVAADVRGLGVTLDKIGTETDALLLEVAELKDAVANSGNVSDELQSAVDAVVARAKSIDEKVPDVSVTGPQPEPELPVAGGLPPDPLTEAPNAS